ncbi:hypothetical protein [Halomonas sp. 707B3]|uniref:hypothetical protein n=1 Tax=Halomonas sp. 707B3 TaxID=1681043 RepID=UPI0020A13C50|nr:hypothetical protein [Halomonas sp. 707B3]MCP1318101.1 hypothetical protein [Halomonas sp. 707B3]
MSNSLLLRKAMQALDLSGVALARRISTYRDDGRVTAPETVSRWLSGTNAVEPSVLAWLEELLRTKALASPRPIIQWPKKRSIVIGVTSSKGGVGTSTVALNLAVVAQLDFKMKTYHLIPEADSSGQYIKEIRRRIGLDTYLVTFQELLDNKPDDNEIHIIDIHSGAAKDALAGKSSTFLEIFEPDILLIPADFGSRMEIPTVNYFANMENLKGRVRLLHRPRSMNMGFHKTCAKEGLDPASEIFCSTFIPQTKSSQLHIPTEMFGSWRSLEQQMYHQDLLEYLITELGGEVLQSHDTVNQIKAMTLLELLDYLQK